MYLFLCTKQSLLPIYGPSSNINKMLLPYFIYSSLPIPRPVMFGFVYEGDIGSLLCSSIFRPPPTEHHSDNYILFPMLPADRDTKGLTTNSATYIERSSIIIYVFTNSGGRGGTPYRVKQRNSPIPLNG
jgi:hypothetical protein